MKQSINIKCDKVIIMNIINDNNFDLYYSLLSNNNMYMKVILKSKLIGIARKVSSTDFREV